MSVYDQILQNQTTKGAEQTQLKNIQNQTKVISLPTIITDTKTIEPQIQQAPSMLKPASAVIFQDVKNVETVQENIEKINLKNTIITNQQKESYANYQRQIFDTLDSTFQNVEFYKLVPVVMIQLMAACEWCVNGKKQGELRQQMVYNSIIQYLQDRRQIIDENHKILLRGFIEQIFILNKNKLKQIFSDLFDTTKSCLSVCQQTTQSGVLQQMIK